MPVCRKYGLHISGLILDGLVPTDAAMRGAEGRHGLDELVDLGIQKCTAILRPPDLGLVCRPVLPGLHREAIARPMELHQQVGAGVAEDEVQTIAADLDEVTVAGSGIVVADCILSLPWTEAVHIITRPADEGIIASAAIEGVVASIASKDVGGTVASEDVVEGVAGPVDGRCAG